MTWKKTLEITLDARDIKDAMAKKPKLKQVKIKPIAVIYYASVGAYGACFECDGVSFIVGADELIKVGEKIKQFEQM